jgi:hypothetical protein
VVRWLANVLGNYHRANNTVVRWLGELSVWPWTVQRLESTLLTSVLAVILSAAQILRSFWDGGGESDLR